MLIYIYVIFRKAIKGVYGYILRKMISFIMLSIATVFIYYVVGEIAIEEFGVNIFTSLEYTIKSSIIVLCVVFFITQYFLGSAVNVPDKRDVVDDEHHTIQTEAREQQNQVIKSTKNTFNTFVNKSQNIKNYDRNISFFLKSKDIDRFYHFTDVRNLESIIANGGLHSWSSIQKKNINSIMSSDELSRALDTRKGLQDYVRLSFVQKHPMKYKVEKERGLNLVLLEVDVSISCLESTLFSDMNATDNNVTVKDDFDFLKTFNYDLFKQRYINLGDLEKKKYQAEILVKDFLPIKYIKNIDILKEKYLDYEEIPF